jgi:hypothetical protein
MAAACPYESTSQQKFVEGIKILKLLIQLKNGRF